MNSMEYLRRINQKYDKGIWDGLRGKNRPGVTWGSLRQAYKLGNNQGMRMRRLRDFKTK